MDRKSEAAHKEVFGQSTSASEMAILRLSRPWCSRLSVPLSLSIKDIFGIMTQRNVIQSPTIGGTSIMAA